MHAGRVLVSDSPAAIVAERQASSLEEAFIGHLQQAMARGRPEGGDPLEEPPSLAVAQAGRSGSSGPGRASLLSLRRFLSCARRELLELSRDPIRVPSPCWEASSSCWCWASASIWTSRT